MQTVATKWQFSTVSGNNFGFGKSFEKGHTKNTAPKSSEMLISSQNFMVDFRAEYRQFDWIEISLVYIGNDKHNTVYNCYNLEKASTFIQSVSLKYILQFYSIANQLRLDVNNSTYNHLMYMQLVNWNCNGCSIASIMVM